MSKILFTLLLISAAAFADESQVILRSDKTEYKLGEMILLSYDTLWLGSDDRLMRFSSTAFPEIEVRFLDRFPVELTETHRVQSLPEPSRLKLRRLRQR